MEDYKQRLISKNGTFSSLFTEPDTIVWNQFLAVSIWYNRWEQQYLINRRRTDFTLLEINETEAENNPDCGLLLKMWRNIS